MKHILLISLIFFSAVICAVPVSQSTAEQAAMNWTNKWAPRDFSNRSIEKVVPIGENNETQLYLFRYADGFVLTGADDTVTPVLAYGYQTKVTEPQDNPAFMDFIKCRQQEIKQLISQKTINGAASEAWSALLANDFGRNETRNMLPLISTKWDQGWPYNMYCPEDAAGSNGHVYVGCVATAMAQVMKYWNWPDTGVGTHSYYSDGYGYQSANFGQTTYDWTQMPNSVGAPNEQIGTLSYQLGVSVDMDYSPSGSGAQSYDAVDALIQHFRYNGGIQLLDKENYSSAAWDQMLVAELENARPVYYHGFGEGGGHAFVCDGYQGTDYFHFNWGWSGAYDGYFYTGNLNPGSEFNWGQGALFNVYPLNYSLSMVRLALQSSNCQVGENVPVSINTYPIMPQWNVNDVSFVIEFDYENMNYAGFESANTMLDFTTISTQVLQPGRIAFTINSAAPLSGAGTLLKLLFQPLMPGSYAFNLADFVFNTTPVTQITQTTINVIAEVNEPQNSVIDLLNAMHIPYNEIATVPVTTTFIMPSWNVLTSDFDVTYPPDLVSWVGYDAADCLAENAAITVLNDVPGTLSFSMSFPGAMVGVGNLIKLNFCAIGNTAGVSLATVTPTNFYYGTVLVLNLRPGYIVLTPVTGNQEEVVVPDVKLSITPNPFRESALLSLNLTKPNQVTEIGIYNLKGQLVRKLFNSTLKGNELDIRWDGMDELRHNAQAGVYLARVQCGSFRKTIKLLKL
jgi:hypothetical protein